MHTPIPDGVTNFENLIAGHFYSGALFKEKTKLYFGENASCLAQADLNSDGKNELVIADYKNNKIIIASFNYEKGIITEKSIASGQSPVDLKVSDMDGDGDLDIVIVNSGSKNITVLINNGNIDFASQTYTTGNSPKSIALTDINNDNLPDIIIANYNGSSISVFINLGNGSFQNQINYATGSYPRSIACGDMDKDGDIDVVVGGGESSSNDSITIFYNNGAGTFNVKENLGENKKFNGIKTCDIDGDGFPDIIGSSYVNNEFYVLINSGSGHAFSYLTYKLSNLPCLIYNNDLDMDGDPDLVVEYNSNLVDIFYNDGQGNLKISESYYTEGVFSKNIEIADFDTDNDFDLIIPYENGQVSILTNQFYQDKHLTSSLIAKEIIISNDSVIGLNSSTPVQLKAKINDESNIDVSGNAYLKKFSSSDPNVLFIDSDGNTIAKNQGICILSAEMGIYKTSKKIVVSDNITRVAVKGYIQMNNGAFIKNAEVTSNFGGATYSDDNGYFILNIPISQNSKLVLQASISINGIQHQASSPQLSVNPGQTTDAGLLILQPKQTAPLFNMNQYNFGNRPTGVGIGDFDNDDDLDMAVLLGYEKRMYVLSNLGNGTYEISATYNFINEPRAIYVTDINKDANLDLVVGFYGSSAQYISTLINQGNGTFIETVGCKGSLYSYFSMTDGDLNKDGNIDFVVSVYGITLFNTQNSGKLITSSKIPNYSTWSNDTVIADVDNDGDSDLVIATDKIYIYLNNGDGSFSETRKEINVAGSVSRLAAGDIDHDGDIDITAVISNTNTMVVLLNQGNLNFNINNYTTESKPVNVILSDFNNDNYPDIAVSNQTSNSISVFINNSSGIYTLQNNYPASKDPGILKSGDFDKNGTNDLAVVTAEGIKILLNKGNAIFRYPASFDFKLTSRPQGSATGDLDQDGDMDIVLSNSDKINVSVYLINPKNGNIIEKIVPTSERDPGTIRTHDLNNDGILDLITLHKSYDCISVLIGSGQGKYNTSVKYTTGDYPYDICIKDYNNDNYADLAIVNYYSETFAIYLNNGNGTFKTPVNYTINVTPTRIISGDVDNDGDSDLVIGSNEKSYIYINQGNGTGIFSQNQNYISGCAYAVEDFDNDGFKDIATRETSSSKNYVYINNKSANFPYFTWFNCGNINSFLPAIDIDQDGDIDIITPNLILFNKGDGTFSGTFTLSSGENFSISDLDCDGDIDIIAVNYSSSLMSLYFNTTTMSNRDLFPLNPKNINLVLNPSFLLNGETKQMNISAELYDGTTKDISNSDYWKLFLSGQLLHSSIDQNGLLNCFSPGIETFKINVEDKSLNQQVSISASQNSVSTKVQGTITLDDGTPVSGAEVTSSNVGGKCITDSNGNFSFDVIIPQGSDISVMASVIINGQTYEKVSVPISVNTNGITQIGALILKQQYSGIMHEIQNEYKLPFAPGSIVSGDLNQDGMEDLVFANNYGGFSVAFLNYYKKILSVSSYKNLSQIQSYYYNNQAYLVDLNNDHCLDILFFNYSDKTVTAFENNGQGIYLETTNFIITTTNTYPTTNPISVGDFNGDGYGDFASTDSSKNIYIWINKKNGTFEKTNTLVYGDYIISGDFIKDGKIDLCVFNYESSQSANYIYTLENNGTGGFNKSKTSCMLYNKYIRKKSFCGDFNGDGFIDLVCSNQYDYELYILFNNGDGSFANEITYNIGITLGDIIVKDIDGDGDLDLICSNTSAVITMINNGMGIFVKKDMYQTNHVATNGYYSTVTTADFDNDKDIDLIVSSNKNSSLKFLSNKIIPNISEPVPPILQKLTLSVNSSVMNNLDSQSVHLSAQLSDSTEKDISYGEIWKTISSNQGIFAGINQNGTIIANLKFGTTNISALAGGLSSNINIEVKDSIPPLINAGNDITAVATGGKTSVTLPIVFVKDINDPNPLVTSNAPSDGFKYGTTVVTYTATDKFGNINSDSINVIITAPQIPSTEGKPIDIIGIKDLERFYVKLLERTITILIRENINIKSLKIKINGEIIRNLSKDDILSIPSYSQYFSLPISLTSNSSHYNIRAEVVSENNEIYWDERNIFFIDYIPNVPISIEEKETTNKNNIHINFSPINLSQMRFGSSSDLTNIQWQNISQPVSYFLSHGDGLKTIFAQFKNIDGMETGVYSAQINLDQTPPGRISDIEVFQVNESQIKLLWNKTNSSDFAGYEIYSNNGVGEVDYNNPVATVIDNKWQSEILNEGNYKFSVRAVDTIGNKGDFSHEVSISLPQISGNQIIFPQDGSIYNGALPIQWTVDSNTNEALTKYEIEYKDFNNTSVNKFQKVLESTPVYFDISNEEWFKVTQPGYQGAFTGFGANGKKYQNGVLVNGVVASWYSATEGSFPRRGLICTNAIYSFDNLILKRWNAGYYIYGVFAYDNGVILAQINDRYSSNDYKYHYKIIKNDFINNLINIEDSKFNLLDVKQISMGSINNQKWYAFDNSIINYESGVTYNVEGHCKFIGDDLYFVKNDTLFCAYNYGSITSFDTTNWETFLLTDRTGYNSDLFLGNKIQTFFVQENKSCFGNGGNRIFIGTESGITVIDENREYAGNNKYTTFASVSSIDENTNYKILPKFFFGIKSIYAFGDVIYIINEGGVKDNTVIPATMYAISLKDNSIIFTKSTSDLKTLQYNSYLTKEILENEINLFNFREILVNENHFLSKFITSELTKYGVYNSIYDAISWNGDNFVTNVYELNYISFIIEVLNSVYSNPALFLNNKSQFQIPENSDSKRKLDELLNKQILFYDTNEVLTSKDNLSWEESNEFIDFMISLFHDNPSMPQLIKYPRTSTTTTTHHFFMTNNEELFLTANSLVESVTSNWIPVAGINDEIYTHNFNGSYLWDVSNVISTDKASLRIRGFDGTKYSDYFYNNGVFAIAGSKEPTGTVSTTPIHLDPYIELQLSNNFNAVSVMIAENSSFNNVLWQDYKDNITYVTPSAGGEITLYVKFKNSSGLESKTVTASFILNENKPYINHIILSDKDTGDINFTNENEVNVFVDVPPDRGVTEMIISTSNNFTGSQWTIYKNKFLFAFDNVEGLKTLYVKVRNSKGEESGVYVVKINYDIEGFKLGEPQSNVNYNFTPNSKYSAKFMYSYNYTSIMYLWVDRNNIIGVDTLYNLPPNVITRESHQMESVIYNEKDMEVLLVTTSPTSRDIWRIKLYSNYYNYYLGYYLKSYSLLITLPLEEKVGLVNLQDKNLVEIYTSKGTEGWKYLSEMLFNSSVLYSNLLNKKASNDLGSINLYEISNKIYGTSPNSEINKIKLYPESKGIINSFVWDKSDLYIYAALRANNLFSIQAIKSDGSGNDRIIYQGVDGEIIKDLKITNDGSKLIYISRIGTTETIKHFSPYTPALSLPACGFYYPEPYRFQSIKNDNNIRTIIDPGYVFTGEKLFILGTATTSKSVETEQVLSDFVSYKLEYKEFFDTEWKTLKYSETPVDKGILGELDINSLNVNKFDLYAYEFKLTVNSSNTSVSQITHLRFDYETVYSHPNNFLKLGEKLYLKDNVTFYADSPMRWNSSLFRINIDSKSITGKDTVSMNTLDNDKAEIIFSSDVCKETYEDSVKKFFKRPENIIFVSFDIKNEGTKIIFYQIEGDQLDKRQGQISFYYDITPPTISSVKLQEIKATGTAKVNINTQGNDIAEIKVWPINDFPTDWLPFNENTQITFPDKEGLTYILVWFRDIAGNETDVFILPITLDKTPPANISIDVLEGEIVNTRDVHLILKANDASQFRISEDSAMTNSAWSEYTGNNNYDYTLSPEQGAKTVYCQFKDVVGNTTEIISTQVTFVSNFISDGFSIVEGNFTNKNSIGLVLHSVNANQVQISERNDFSASVPELYSENKTFILSSIDGLKKVYVKFINQASDEIGIVSQKIELDTIAPLIELSSPKNNSTLTGN
ncbi:MAG: Vcbs [uncultured bacterium]|nr:MAG: Vcbs [uncultured bacterium]